MKLKIVIFAATDALQLAATFLASHRHLSECLSLHLECIGATRSNQNNNYNNNNNNNNNSDGVILLASEALAPLLRDDKDDSVEANLFKKMTGKVKVDEEEADDAQQQPDNDDAISMASAASSCYHLRSACITIPPAASLSVVDNFAQRLSRRGVEVVYGDGVGGVVDVLIGVVGRWIEECAGDEHHQQQQPRRIESPRPISTAHGNNRDSSNSSSNSNNATLRRDSSHRKTAKKVVTVIKRTLHISTVGPESQVERENEFCCRAA